MGLFTRAAYLPLALIAGYSLVLILLTIPVLQQEVLYLHRIRIPFFVKYNNPERYGLAPYKTRNFYLNTTDGETIGVWHVLPRSVYLKRTEIPPKAPLHEKVFEHALAERPTIIYFHGNAGTRAVDHRVRNYCAFSNTLDVNVLAMDYRGYGDSTGTPSEPGLLKDARAAYNYISTTALERGAKNPSGDIVLLGQSLGTGVVSALAGQLAGEGIYPRALVLVAPFSSIASLLLEYKLFFVIPLLSPLKAFPALQERLLSTLEANFDSATALMNTKSPTLILHAIDDDIIPHSHSKTLFNHLHASSLSSSADSLLKMDIEETDYPGWGRTSQFNRGGNGGEVIWWEGLTGGHNRLGWAEGTIELIQRVAAL